MEIVRLFGLLQHRQWNEKKGDLFRKIIKIQQQAAHLLQFFSKLDHQVSDDIKASKEIICNKDLIIWVSVRMQLHYKDTEQYVSK